MSEPHRTKLKPLADESFERYHLRVMQEFMDRHDEPEYDERKIRQANAARSANLIVATQDILRMSPWFGGRKSA